MEETRQETRHLRIRYRILPDSHTASGVCLAGPATDVVEERCEVVSFPAEDFTDQYGPTMGRILQVLEARVGRPVVVVRVRAPHEDC